MLYFAGIFCIFNLFLFSLVTTKTYINDPLEAFMSMMTNFEWNFYDVMLVIIVIRATTSASGEGKKTTKFIHKIVNTSMDRKLNGRVSKIGFCRSNLKLFHRFSLKLWSWWIFRNKLHRLASIFHADFSTTTGRFALKYETCKLLDFKNAFMFFAFVLNFSVYQCFCHVSGDFNSIWVNASEEKLWKIMAQKNVVRVDRHNSVKLTE